MEGFFPVYRGKVLPRGQYLLGWVLCTWEIPTLVSFSPLAIPTQVRVPETNRGVEFRFVFHIDTGMGVDTDLQVVLRGDSILKSAGKEGTFTLGAANARC